MSWNNVIPNSVLHDIIKKIESEPKQLHFDEELFAPCYTIKEEYLTSCNEAFSWISPTGHGPNGTVAKSVDYPAFAALRKHLATLGYIEMQTSWTNGDRVLKHFHLNKVPFKPGESFLSASAMKGFLQGRERRRELPLGYYDYA